MPHCRRRRHHHHLTLLIFLLPLCPLFIAPFADSSFSKPLNSGILCPFPFSHYTFSLVGCIHSGGFMYQPADNFQIHDCNPDLSFKFQTLTSSIHWTSTLECPSSTSDQNSTHLTKKNKQSN